MQITDRVECVTAWQAHIPLFLFIDFTATTGTIGHLLVPIST